MRGVRRAKGEHHISPLATRMKRFNPVKWIVIIILVIGCGACVYGYWQLSKLHAFLPPPRPTRTHEQIFGSRVFDGQPIPQGITDIEAIEGPVDFGYSNGPAYVRFQATDTSLKEIIETDYGFNGMYTSVSCKYSPITDNLIKVEGWRPSEITSPICYSTATCVLYDEKYLLIDKDNNMGYFYRTAICGLCPNGLEGRALGESPRCKKYHP